MAAIIGQGSDGVTVASRYSFLSDTEAPSLGLYLTKDGDTYEVVRDDAGLVDRAGTMRFCVDPTVLFSATDTSSVRAFLRGYAAACQHPALVELVNTIDADADIAELSAVAEAAAQLVPGGGC